MKKISRVILSVVLGLILFSTLKLVSSNTGIVTAIDRAYSKNPEKFVDRLYKMNLSKNLDLSIIGENKTGYYPMSRN